MKSDYKKNYKRNYIIKKNKTKMLIAEISNQIKDKSKTLENGRFFLIE
jgi:hypothetical protein